jgi:hypothetical protein
VSDERPHDPTSPQQPLPEEGERPDPPQPAELQDDVDRTFDAGGRRWIARRSGKAAWGTGAYGLGLVDAVHFYDATDPSRPLFEALLASGRFPHLYDSELSELLAKATPIAARDER